MTISDKQFSTDLTPRKSSIKVIIQEKLTKLADDEADEEDDDEDGDGDGDAGKDKKPSTRVVKA